MCITVVDNDVLVASYNCNEVKYTGQSENSNQSYSGIQECTSSKCICAIGCFEFSLSTGNICGSACITVFGSVFGTLLLIGAALLEWSSFEYGTIQGNG